MLLFILLPPGDVFPAVAAADSARTETAAASTPAARLSTGNHVTAIDKSRLITAVYPRIISLNGTWQRQFLDHLDLVAIKPDKWETVQVPSMNQGGKGHFAAYRTNFSLENPDEGIIPLSNTYRLYFRGVAFACQIYLDGTFVAEHGPTLEPFSVDLTPFIRKRFPSHSAMAAVASKPHELTLLIQDWTSGVEGLSAAELKADLAGSRGKNAAAEFSPGSPFDESLMYRTIAPMGGSHGLFGIWDDARLEIYPGVHLADVAVRSFVSRGKVRIGVRIENDGEEPWRGRLRLALRTAPAAEIAVKTLSIEAVGAGQARQLSAELDGRGLEPWEPGNPAMYELAAELLPDPGRRTKKGGSPPSRIVLYRSITPFGYREIKWKNQNLFLNGRKIHLFTASIGNHGLTREELRKQLTQLRDLNLNIVRFHGNVFPTWYYSMADQMGIMVVAESALYGSYATQFNFNSDRFFDNAAIHWKGLVEKLRNNPSVILYSIENECVEYSLGPQAEKKFAELGRKVKEWDPTRPILFNGGDDPGGVADIISLHYPHELPFWNRYPRDAWWLKAVTGGRMISSLNDVGKKSQGSFAGSDERGIYIDSFKYHKPNFRWSWARKKPLDLGEIGYPTGGEPNLESILLGDDAYAIDARAAQDAAQAEIWKQNIEAARASDVAMINPWNPPAGPKTNEALKEALQPVRFILYPEARERYYGGARVKWRGVLLNDTRGSKRLTFRYTLRPGDRGSPNRPTAKRATGKGRQFHEAVADAVSQTVTMGPFPIAPGGSREITLSLALPRVKQIGNYEVIGTVIDGEGGAEVGQWSKPVVVYPLPNRHDWRSIRDIILFDPRGKTEQLFKTLGVGYEKEPDPARFLAGNERDKTWVIGVEALGDLSPSELATLNQRIMAGAGVLLVLDQTAYPPGFPAGMTLNGRHGTTLGFVAAPSHPLFNTAPHQTMDGKGQPRPAAGIGDARLSDADFREWGADLSLSQRDFNLPVGGGYRPLIVSGGTGGLLYAPLVEKPGAGGTTLFCQIPLVEKFREEPAAAILLNKILKYLDNIERENTVSPVTVSRLELPPGMEETLEDWGIETSPADGATKTVRLLDARRLDDNASETLRRMMAWVAEGNVLWIFGLDPSRPIEGLAYEPLANELLPVKINKSDKLTDGLLNQHLYWPKRYFKYAYAFSPLIPPAPWVLRIPTGGADGQASGLANLPWRALTFPVLIVSAEVGRGRILLDTLNWGELLKRKEASLQGETGKAKDGIPPGKSPAKRDGYAPVAVIASEENQERAVRFFTGMLTNLGTRLESTPVLQIEAEEMTEKTPGQPIILNRNHYYWEITTNNHLAQEFEIPTDHASKTVIDIKAQSFFYIDIPPRMQVLLDGKVIGECDVKEPFWHLYRFEAWDRVAPGRHRIEIRLVNNPEDVYNWRTLSIDWVRIN